jgi:hypothetical protein
MKEYKIYALIDPITDSVRYVGVTTGYLSSRLSQHKHAAIKKNSGTRVYKWIRSLVAQNMFPKIKLIEICDKEAWEKREKFWIKQFNNLTNTHEGGVGVVIDRKTDSIQRAANGHKKEVVILSLDYTFIKEFDSVTACSNFLNIGITSISNALTKKGSTKSAANHIILYKKDYIQGNFEKTYIHKSKKVYQYSDKGMCLNTFNSVTEALNTVKPCKYISGIIEAIKTKCKCGLYYWTHEEIINFNDFLQKKKKRTKWDNPNYRKK